MAVFCKHVCYSGDVQGVGFRHTARMLAQGFAVSGYVRNLPDGRVQLLVEGEAAEVDRYLGDLARKMSSYIAEQEIQEELPQGFSGFVIRL
jgi:acylphosphatase